MRFTKPLLAAAAVLSIAAPAASALADPYWGDHDYGPRYEHDYGLRYERARYEWGREHFWREREMAREREAWRRHAWRERHEYRGYGWRY